MTKVEVLNKMIREEPQFTAMNTYCAGELIILGVIEHAQGNCALQMQQQVLQFKVNQNIWLNIQVIPSQQQTPTFRLKDLIVCEYKYKVVP